MKKNKFMKLASGLLVLCLMTTCVIGATLAKYVTSDNGTDSARVAKWGVRITAVANSAFDKQYTNGSSEVTVNSSASDNVVAPGTSGDAVQFTITGTPEVAVRLSFAMTVTNEVMLASGDYKYDNGNTVNVADDYYPVVFTLKKGEATLETGKLSVIATYLNTHPVDFDANTDLSTAVGTYTLSWTWAFDDDVNIGVNDVADTLLGDIAASSASIVKADDDAAIVEGADKDYNLKVSYSLTITATQID